MSRTRTRTRRLRLDTLENRLAPATATLDMADRVLRITGTDGPDTIQVRHANGQVSIDNLQITVVDVDIVGTFDSVAAADVSAVDVKALAGNDAIFVEDLADGTALTINAGLGQDVNWIHERTTWAPTSFDGGTGHTDYLYVYDLRPGPHAYTVTDTAVTGPGMSLPYANLTALLVFSTNDAADTFDVQSTRAGTQTHLWGYGGNDTFRVGGPAGLDGVRGDVFVQGFNGTDALAIDNTGGSAATRFEVGPVQTRLPWGAVIDYNQGAEAVTVRGGAIDETFALTGSSPTVPLTVDGGGGANTLEYLENAGLAAWYPGEGSAADAVNANHGTPSGSVGYTAGRVGQAFQFGGYESPGFVRVPNAPELEPATVTVEAWVNSTHINDYGAYSYIVSKGAADFRGASYALVTSINGGLWFYVGNGSAFAYSPDPGTGIWDGNWHHVVGTYDGSIIRLYVDGVQIGSGNRLDNVLGYGLPNTNDLYIGTYGGLPGYTFRGRIDEPSVYNRALTAAEVQGLFANGKASPWAEGVTVNLPAGTATGIAGGIANIRHVIGASGSDSLTGDALDNRLSGRAGNDTLIGSGGPDVLDGGDGSDYLAGGSGDDTYTFAAAAAAETDTAVETFALGLGRLDFSRLAADNPVSINLLSAADLARHARRAVVVGAGGTPSGFHVAVGGAGNDFIQGNHRNNVLDGGAGNDTVDGANGRDTMYGQAGDDRLTGGDQNDLMGGGPGRDWMFGQEGDDWVFGEDGDDSLLGGNGWDILFAEAGNDYLQGDFGRDSYFGGDGNDYAYEYGDTADYFDGGDGNDYLYEADGSDGNDTMYGGAGDDTVTGGLGNDRLEGDDGNDDLRGAQGNDTLLGEAGNDRLTGGSTFVLTNHPDNDRLEGGDGDDILDGGHNKDLSNQGVYRDSIFGGRGNDILYGGKSREYLDGGRGRDVMYGDDGRDTLVGDDGRPEVLNDGEEDLLYPGRGQDVLITDPFDRVIDISEIENISPTSGDAPVALQPGTLVTIDGTGLPATARLQFGGSYEEPVAAAQALDTATSPDGRRITGRVPRGAMSGIVWVIDTKGTTDEGDDTWESAPGYFTVRTFRNTNGFKFSNFGFNVSVPLVQDSFGAEQTNIWFGPVLTPFPTPQTLALTALGALAFNGKGACFGMALMSQHLAHHPEWFNGGIGLPPNSAPTVFNLTPDGDLINFIERFHMHQFSQELINYTIGWKLSGHSKSGIYDQIRDRLLTGDRPLISFQNGIAQGHVVVAYDLEWALDTPETDDYYIHTYDPNRPYGSTKTTEGITLDSAAMNGQKIADSRIYVGSNNLSSGNEWRFKMGSEFWAGGFGDFMVIPYGTVPPAPRFPGSLPSLAELILGTQTTGDAPAIVGTELPAADGLAPRTANPVRVATVATIEDRPTQRVETEAPVVVTDAGAARPASLPSWEGLTDSDEWKVSVG